MEQDGISFYQWFDIFVDQCRRLGYYGLIDQETFKSDYDNDVTPEKAAKDFVDEMNS